MCRVIAQHPVNKTIEKISFFGRKTVKKTAAHGEAAILQSVRPAAAGGSDLHQHFATNPAAPTHQAVGLQSVDETDSRRMGEANDSRDLTDACRRVVGGGNQRGNGRWRQIVIFGKRCVGDGQ